MISFDLYNQTKNVGRIYIMFLFTNDTFLFQKDQEGYVVCGAYVPKFISHAVSTVLGWSLLQPQSSKSVKLLLNEYYDSTGSICMVS